MSRALIPNSTITRFAITEHTADVGLVAWGPTPAASFVAAAQGMFAIGLGTYRFNWQAGGEIGEKDVHVHAAEWPQLLVEWLVELLGLFEVAGFPPQAFDVLECQSTSFAARMQGVRVSGPSATMAIKAVTYHELAVDVRRDRTEIRVIFDI